MEEHRQAERLQRQLQQEQAYLMSLQLDHRPQPLQQPPQQPQPQQPPMQPPERSKQIYHTPEPKPHYDPAERVREVNPSLDPVFVYLCTEILYFIIALSKCLLHT